MNLGLANLELRPGSWAWRVGRWGSGDGVKGFEGFGGFGGFLDLLV